MIRVSVFSFPETNPNKSKVFDSLNNLAGELHEELELAGGLNVVDGNRSHPEYSALLSRFLNYCEGAIEGIDLLCVGHLSLVATTREPSAKMDAIFKQVCPKVATFIDKVKDIQSVQAEVGTGPELGVQFLYAEGVKLIHKIPIDGAAWGKYPSGISMVNSFRKELTFHELLHQFGVSEGYDDNTRAPNKGCENCWMQYLPWEGSGLCESHSNELRAFFAGLSPLSSKRRVLDLRNGK